MQKNLQGEISAELAKALSAFQNSVEKIDLDGEVKFKGVQFSYATLGNIIEKIRKPMHSAGLSHCSTIEDGCLVTRLICAEDGSHISSRMPIKLEGDPKQIGGSITYFRRYCLVAILGIIGEEDRDAPEQATSKPLMTDAYMAQILTRIAQGETDGLLDSVLKSFEVTGDQITVIINALDG